MKDIKAVTIKAIETSINERAETGIGNGEIGMVRLALVQGFITEADAEHYIDCIMSMSRVDEAEEAEEEKKELTDAEIKKAWDTMKKELKKEFKNVDGLHGGFVMNAKQIKNRTATFTATGWESYEERIADYIKGHETVMTYDSWSDKAKQDHKVRTEEKIAYTKAKKAQFGTIENEAETYFNMIQSSKAFAKFCKTVGKVEMHREKNADQCNIIRFTY